MKTKTRKINKRRIDLSDQVIAFLKEHPEISPTRLEKLSEMPKTTIGQAMSHPDVKIPAKHIDRLIELLESIDWKNFRK